MDLTAGMDDEVPSAARYKDESEFVVSPLIHVGSFLAECKDVLESEEELLPVRMERSPEEIAERIGTSLEIVHELERVCSPRSLDCPAEKKYPMSEGVLGTRAGIPSGTAHLTTIQLRHRLYSKLDSKSFNKSETLSVDCHARYVTDEEDIDCVNKPTVLLAVTIFKPSETILQRYVYRPKSIDRELYVLADQKLTSLRDKLICAADLSVQLEDCSECPNIKQTPRARSIYKSSYFLIEDTFYNDMRDPMSMDLSKVVINSARHKTLFSKSMDDVAFNELSIKLGFPYLYCHLGNCHHVMVFTELRLLTNTDCQELDQYPVLMYKPHWKRTMCICCSVYTARWITKEDSFSTMDPSFFCDACFKMLHYDKDGKKLGSFVAYPYTDPGVFN